MLLLGSSIMLNRNMLIPKRDNHLNKRKKKRNTLKERASALVDTKAKKNITSSLITQNHKLHSVQYRKRHTCTQISESQDMTDYPKIFCLICKAPLKTKFRAHCFRNQLVYTEGPSEDRSTSKAI